MNVAPPGTEPPHRAEPLAAHHAGPSTAWLLDHLSSACTLCCAAWPHVLWCHGHLAISSLALRTAGLEAQWCCCAPQDRAVDPLTPPRSVKGTPRARRWEDEEQVQLVGRHHPGRDPQLTATLGPPSLATAPNSPHTCLRGGSPVSSVHRKTPTQCSLPLVTA